MSQIITDWQRRNIFFGIPEGLGNLTRIVTDFCYIFSRKKNQSRLRLLTLLNMRTHKFVNESITLIAKESGFFFVCV